MSMGDLRILVAEDELISRILMQEMMKGLGCVHTAANGKEAIEAARMALQRRKPYQLICLDIMMPEVDGLAALAAIRQLEDEADLPPMQSARILMTSASGEMSHVKAAAAGRCDGYLIKPIERNALMRQLAKLLLPVQGAANAAG